MKRDLFVGVSKLGVAFTEEAVILRNSGIDVPILVFFDRDNIDTCLRYNLTPVLFNLKTARQYSSAARKKNRTIPVHVKVDTGMGRVGFTLESAVSSITKIAGLKNIQPVNSVAAAPLFFSSINSLPSFRI